ncbi:MAG TPA: phosphatidate cytidylyltransferase [Bdellovibrionota bacterium]|jgi:phosphatidate cytidylyltransferase|nr:phosphatidate cytidylyltransferase [Bdellovibrionota bacterium]
MNFTFETKQRVLWGLVLGVALIIIILYLGPTAIAVTTTLAAALGWREYSRMHGIMRYHFLHYLGFSLVIALMVSSFVDQVPNVLGACLVPLASILSIFLEDIFSPGGRCRSKTPEESRKDFQAFMLFNFGIYYIAMVFGFVPLIAIKSDGHLILFFALLVVTCVDTGSYMGGRMFGKRKLWPSISPGKTIEGFLGGLIAAIAAGVLFPLIAAKFFSSPIEMEKFLLGAIVATPLAVAGDNIESLIKRGAGVKDSGGLIPGHGGILDRADSLLFVIPFFYYLF